MILAVGAVYSHDAPNVVDPIGLCVECARNRDIKRRKSPNGQHVTMVPATQVDVGPYDLPPVVDPSCVRGTGERAWNINRRKHTAGKQEAVEDSGPVLI